MFWMDTFLVFPKILNIFLNCLLNHWKKYQKCKNLTRIVENIKELSAKNGKKKGLKHLVVEENCLKLH